MQRILTLTAAVLIAGPVLAQTTAPSTTAPAPMANPTPMTNSSGTSGATGSSNPAVNTTGNAPSSVNASGRANMVEASALEKGSNSFTEGQTKSRLEGAGLSNVSDLKKDNDGIWRGKAMQSGRSVTVGFDYKGNISAQ